MYLYFMRHGQAEQNVTLADEDRRLTPEGEQRVGRAAQVLAQLKIQPEVIYASPRVRAHQTAQIVAKALGMTVVVHPAVNFEFDLAAVRQFLTDHPNAEALMFVGHNPSMEQVIGALTGANVTLKPGSFARVDVDPLGNLRGELVWLIAPKVFDSLND